MLIYKENGEFVIERVNGFNHSFKRKFISEYGLLEVLQTYEGFIRECELEVSEEPCPLVINFLIERIFKDDLFLLWYGE